MGTQTGRAAEELVAHLLKKQGHQIITLNWRTRWCEIDIVSSQNEVLYFTEVKYRSNSAWGEGTDYVVSKKHKQMHFAAEFWLAKNNWAGDALMQIASVDAENDVVFIVLDGSETT